MPAETTFRPVVVLKPSREDCECPTCGQDYVEEDGPVVVHVRGSAFGALGDFPPIGATVTTLEGCRRTVTAHGYMHGLTSLGDVVRPSLENWGWTDEEGTWWRVTAVDWCSPVPESGENQ